MHLHQLNEDHTYTRGLITRTKIKRCDNEYLLYTLVVLARFFELSNEIFGFIGPLRGWQQGNLTFETPKESKRSIFRSCQPRKGPINPKIELDYQKIKPKDQSM